MKILLSRILFLAAVGLASTVSSQAQVSTLSTTDNFSGGTIPIGPNGVYGQTFTNIEAISSFTYNFFSAGNSNATKLSAQWAVYNGSGSMSSLANWTTIQTFPEINIPAFVSANTNGWTQFSNGHGGPYNTYTVEMNFSGPGGWLITDPSLTYALLLTEQNGITAGATLGWDSMNEFTYGDASVGFSSAFDYTFSNIVYVKGGEIVPIPETSTVASLSAAALVAALVVFRIRQRRQLALAPAAAA